MPKRRDPLAAALNEDHRSPPPHRVPGRVPLRAAPGMRRLFPRAEPGGVWVFESDAPPRPQPIIRAEAVARCFGAGVYATLTHPDHWRMIAAGWFSGPDLHLPTPFEDESFLVWHAFHHPVNEAHDILAALFTPPGTLRRWRGTRLSNGLTFRDDAGTPRHATARVHSDLDLIRVAEDVAQKDIPLEIVLPDAVLPLLD